MEPHQAINQSKSNEWYTPFKFTDAARLVMGSIDLDPASNSVANEWIKATKYYTIEEDGLSHSWQGKIWMNPPYGRGGQKAWTTYLLDQYTRGNITEAICLVNAATGDSWFKPLWDYPLCFPYQRIKFIGKGDSPTHSNAIVYLGSNTERFAKIFGKFGAVVKLVVYPS